MLLKNGPEFIRMVPLIIMTAQATPAMEKSKSRHGTMPKTVAIYARGNHVKSAAKLPSAFFCFRL